MFTNHVFDGLAVVCGPIFDRTVNSCKKKTIISSSFEADAKSTPLLFLGPIISRYYNVIVRPMMEISVSSSKIGDLQHWGLIGPKLKRTFIGSMLKLIIF